MTKGPGFDLLSFNSTKPMIQGDSSLALSTKPAPTISNNERRSFSKEYDNAMNSRKQTNQAQERRSTHENRQQSERANESRANESRDRNEAQRSDNSRASERRDVESQSTENSSRKEGGEAADRSKSNDEGRAVDERVDTVSEESEGSVDQKLESHSAVVDNETVESKLEETIVSYVNGGSEDHLLKGDQPNEISLDVQMSKAALIPAKIDSEETQVDTALLSDVDALTDGLNQSEQSANILHGKQTIDDSLLEGQLDNNRGRDNALAAEIDLGSVGVDELDDGLREPGIDDGQKIGHPAEVGLATNGLMSGDGLTDRRDASLKGAMSVNAETTIKMDTATKVDSNLQSHIGGEVELGVGDEGAIKLESKASINPEIAASSTKVDTVGQIDTKKLTEGEMNEKAARDKSILGQQLQMKADNGQSLKDFSSNDQSLDEWLTDPDALTQSSELEQTDSGKRFQTRLDGEIARHMEQRLEAARHSPLTTKINTSFHKPDWSSAVSQRILWLANQDVTSAKIIMDPPELGPIEVQLKIKSDSSQVAFYTHSSAVKEVLEGSLSRLREMFEAQGLNLADAGVFDQSEQQRFEEESSNDSGGRSAKGEDSSESVNDTILETPVSDALVDYYA